MTTTTTASRYAPLWPRFAALGFRTILPLAERYYRSHNIHRPDSVFASERARELAARLARGETAYLVGMNIGGFHNSGVALVEVTPSGGPRIICNNEEERFSGEKHSNRYPRQSVDALADIMAGQGIAPDKIVAWLATYDFPLFFASGFRSMLEEFPASLDLALRDHSPSYDGEQIRAGLHAPQELAARFDLDRPAPIIGMPHHDNHAVFSYQVSPFAADPSPTMIAVIDGSGDFASISLYLGENRRVRPLRSNASIFDSLGMFYAVISSTQGGWTALSSEGRYMGAAAYGDMSRATNRYYPGLRAIFELAPGGGLRLNRSLANWPRSMLHKPYTQALIDILGTPISPSQMWNPDAVLRVEDIHHRPNTQERLDKAAATQLVFEDGLFHVIDGLIREAGAEKLVLTGGAALNAVANMRLLEQFDETYYRRVLGRAARLHMWVPPVPGDSGVTIGAAYAFAARAGVGLGPRLEHAFYCGRASRLDEIRAALGGAFDVVCVEIGDVSRHDDVEAIADLMAYITERDGIIALFQGPAETGPRALGHRSILANPRNPQTRETLNERVKYREVIRPLAPMATLAAAQELFELSDGAADDDYNAYNYMVLTVRAKPCARERVPSVVHADGTARVQIVRKNVDPVVHSYLKALGRRIGVEVAVNTSFNVAGPIVQTPVQAVETLRRAKGMDGVFMISAEGPALLVWLRREGASKRIESWLADWRTEVGMFDPADKPI